MSRPYITVTKGSFLEVTITYSDADGVGEDISTDEFAIYEASHPLIVSTAVLTKTEPVDGQLKLYIPAETIEELRMGNVNWFRIVRVFADERPKTTELIGINIE